MKKQAVLAILIWTLTTLARATEATGGAWVFTVENDKFFAGSDRHYTQGFKLTHVKNQLPAGWLEERLAKIFGHFTSADVEQARMAYSLGQDIFTPTKTKTTKIISSDMPYAAWLYGSLSFQVVTEQGAFSAEAMLGVVGPAALGRQVQNGWHDLIGVTHANGWDNQLANEPGLNIALDWRRRLVRKDWTDVTPRLAVALGNVDTHASVGGTLRLGPSLPDDYGPDLIRGGSGFQADPTTRSWNGYFFTTVEVRAVARNLFLDGNTWRDSPSVSKRPVVMDLCAGFALRHRVSWGQIKAVRLIYAQNYRTKAFYGQASTDVFGSLSLAVLY